MRKTFRGLAVAGITLGLMAPAGAAVASDHGHGHGRDRDRWECRYWGGHDRDRHHQGRWWDGHRWGGWCDWDGHR